MAQTLFLYTIRKRFTLRLRMFMFPTICWTSIVWPQIGHPFIKQIISKPMKNGLFRKEYNMIVQTLNRGKMCDTVTTHTTLKIQYETPEGELIFLDFQLKQYEKDGTPTGAIYNNDCVDVVVNSMAETISDMILFDYQEVAPPLPSDYEARNIKEVDDKPNQ